MWLSRLCRHWCHITSRWSCARLAWIQMTLPLHEVSRCRLISMFRLASSWPPRCCIDSRSTSTKRRLARRIQTSAKRSTHWPCCTRSRDGQLSCFICLRFWIFRFVPVLLICVTSGLAMNVVYKMNINGKGKRKGIAHSATSGNCCCSSAVRHGQSCWQRAASSVGTVNKHSSHSPVRPWVCLCVFGLHDLSLCWCMFCFTLDSWVISLHVVALA